MSTEARFHLLALLSVAAIVCGQLLFKATAEAGLRHGVLGARPIVLMGGAVCLYAAASVLWLIVLRHLPLTRVFPYGGITFIAVPIASRLLFDEQLGPWQALGFLLICTGVSLAVFGR